MNYQELTNALGFVNSPKGELQIIIYAKLTGIDEPRKLDIKSTDLPDLKTLFVNGIQTLILSNSNYSVVPLSLADERKNCFYKYDLELPKDLQLLKDVVGNDSLQNFSFADNKLSNIEDLIIVIADDDNEISLFKKLSTVEIIGRGSSYILWKSNSRLEKFDSQLLRISSKFQALKVLESIIIIDLNTIEKSFGFYDVITREARSCISSIRNMQIVSNIDSLETLITDVSFARKLVKAAMYSPVIKRQIPNSQIIEFAKTHPLTKNMKLNPDGSQFNLDTKKSKQLFIKLLSDDFLISELTKLNYDSFAKDGIEIEAETADSASTSASSMVATDAN